MCDLYDKNEYTPKQKIHFPNYYFLQKCGFSVNIKDKKLYLKNL